MLARLKPDQARRTHTVVTSPHSYTDRCSSATQNNNTMTAWSIIFLDALKQQHQAIYLEEYDYVAQLETPPQAKAECCK